MSKTQWKKSLNCLQFFFEAFKNFEDALFLDDFFIRPTIYQLAMSPIRLVSHASD